MLSLTGLVPWPGDDHTRDKGAFDALRHQVQGAKAAMTSSGFDALMDRVCRGLGFCGGVVDDRSVHVTDFIPEEGSVTADAFVDMVFLGDGMDPAHGPERWQHIKAQIRAAFVTHMGAEAVDARLLRWSDR